MKVRDYDIKDQNIFPVYASTLMVGHRQLRILRETGFDKHQVFVVTSGSGRLHIGGKGYEIKTGDMFYIAADVPHEYYGSEDFYTAFLSFFGDGFERIKEYYGLSDFGVYIGKSQGAFIGAAEKIYDIFDSVHETSRLCALTFSAVIAFFDEAHKREYSPIETVYNYLHENYSDTISLEDILKKYPYSKTKLYRGFKERYKLSVVEMLIDIRLKNAAYMLRGDPGIGLSTVAKACGFSDTSYFCKMYRRKFGKSPKGKAYASIDF